MWNEPVLKWRKAQKQHQCQGDGCVKVIEPGERYLDRSLRDLANGHLRYCYSCAEPIIARAKGYHAFNGRNDFPDCYQQRISTGEWKSLKRVLVDQRGSRCERCGQECPSLELHHRHYHSLGFEKPGDVELLCKGCHASADEARQVSSKPKHGIPEEGLIVGNDGDHWGQLDPNTIYIPLRDGRYLPLTPKRKP